MRIVQLLESKTSKVYSQLSQLPGINSYFLKWIFRTYKPKIWYISGEKCQFKNLVPYLMNKKLKSYESQLIDRNQIYPRDLIILHNTANSITMIVNLTVIRKSFSKAVYDVYTQNSIDYDLDEGRIFHGEMTPAALESIFRTDLSASDADQIIVFYSNEDIHKTAHKNGIARLEKKDKIYKFFEELHTHLYVSIKRRLKNQLSVSYNDFVHSIDSKKYIQKSRLQSNFFELIWGTTLNSLVTRIENGKIPFESVTDRKKALDIFIDEYTKRIA